MIEHIVLFKLKEPLSGNRFDAAIAALEGMQQRIPGITEVAAGNSVSPEDKEQGYQFGLWVRFESLAARDRYLTDPEHTGVIREHFSHLIADVLVFDLEH